MKTHVLTEALQRLREKATEYQRLKDTVGAEMPASAADRFEISMERDELVVFCDQAQGYLVQFQSGRILRAVTQAGFKFRRVRVKARSIESMRLTERAPTAGAAPPRPSCPAGAAHLIAAAEKVADDRLGNALRRLAATVQRSVSRG